MSSSSSPTKILWASISAWTARFAGDYEIVGVVRDAKYTDPEKPARAMFFLPLEQTMHYDEPLMQSLEVKSHFMDGIQLRLRG